MFPLITTSGCLCPKPFYQYKDRVLNTGVWNFSSRPLNCLIYLFVTLCIIFCLFDELIWGFFIITLQFNTSILQVSMPSLLPASKGLETSEKAKLPSKPETPFEERYVIYWASLVAQMVKHLPAMRETWVRSLGWEDTLEKEMATHSSPLAWKIPWTEEPGRLQSMGLQRVGHDWAT